MRRFVIGAVAVTGFIGVVAACGSKDQTPQPVAPTATQPGSPPPGPGTQSTYAPPGPATAPPPGGAVPTTAPAMAVPSPVATPCQNDGPCLTHHCNLQYRKCAFPCQNSEADCIAPNVCNAGICGRKLM